MRIAPFKLRQAVALEAGGNHRHLHVFAHFLVHHHAEVNLHVFILRRRPNQVAGFVHIVNAELARSSDVDEHAARTQELRLLPSTDY